MKNFTDAAITELITKIKSALNLKANIASPALTGTPTAPTAAVGTNTTQISTTAYTTSAISAKIDPKNIVANTDLNTIVDDGYYGCAVNATAATLLNCPVTEAFEMEVRRFAASDTPVWLLKHQIMRSYSGGILFIRKLSSGESGVWTFASWSKYTADTGTAATLENRQTFTGAKAFSKGLISYGNDTTTLPTNVGDYITIYDHDTYGLRLLGYNGTTYRPFTMGAMISTGVFAMQILANGDVLVNGRLRLPSMTTDPTGSLLAGMSYYNSTDKVVKYYDGTAWKKIGGGTAAETTYSNTTSGMTATNVQAAVDEVHNEAKNSVQTSAIQDDLLGTDATKVLSAPQGKVLDWKITTINSNLGTLSFVKNADGKWGYKVAGADPVIPFSSYEGYTLPTFQLLSSYISTNPFTSAGSQVWIPLTNAKGISLTYVLQNYNDITANLVDNDGNTIPAFSHAGRGGYSGSYTNNSFNKNYKWLSISVSSNGESTNTATVSDIHVTT